MMSDSDKTTIKLHAHPDKAKGVVPQSNLTPEQEKSLELAKRNAKLEEENLKLLEYVKTIDQLRESLKREQSKAAEIEAKAVAMEAKLKQLAEMEAKVKNVAELEAKVKELTGVIGKISGIATSGKAG